VRFLAYGGLPREFAHYESPGLINAEVGSSLHMYGLPTSEVGSSLHMSGLPTNQASTGIQCWRWGIL